jgi:hypothetical protein
MGLDVNRSTFLSPDKGRTANLIVMRTNRHAVGNALSVGYGQTVGHMQSLVKGWLAQPMKPMKEPMKPMKEHMNHGLSKDVDTDNGPEKPITNGDHYTVGTTHEQMFLRAASATTIADFEHGDMVSKGFTVIHSDSQGYLFVNRIFI